MRRTTGTSLLIQLTFLLLLTLVVACSSVPETPTSPTATPFPTPVSTAESTVVEGAERAVAEAIGLGEIASDAAG